MTSHGRGLEGRRGIRCVSSWCLEASRTVLDYDQCRYWPECINPVTNLVRASTGIGESTYRPIGPCTAGTWAHTRLTYVPEPSDHTCTLYKESLTHQNTSDTHIFITYTYHKNTHIGRYIFKRQNITIQSGCERGTDQLQALCQAVKAALSLSFTTYPGHTFLWLRPINLSEKILTLKPHRYTHLTYDTRALITDYLTLSDTNSLILRHFDRAWPGTPSDMDYQSITDRMDALANTPPHPLEDMTPKQAMWARIRVDYAPSPNPSHSACVAPDGNKLPPAIRAAAASNSRLITSTIFRIATGHCFDADYSDRFRPTAGDRTICPCETIPRRHRQPRQNRHTRHHVLFQCPTTAEMRSKHLTGITTLRQILLSQEDTSHLCDFLSQSNSTLLRPLPEPRQVPEPRPDPWPDP
jgi:hypothetical protein